MLDGLAIFKDVKGKRWDEVKSKKKIYAGDDFHEQAIFKVCMLDVIDTSIKEEATQPPIQKKKNRRDTTLRILKAGFSCVKFVNAFQTQPQLFR